jgi:rRNA maturation RNase YbeY
MINVICPSRYKFDKKALREHANNHLVFCGVPSSAVLNVVFVGKRKMKSIASQYKGEDVALPVLAFPYDESYSSDEHLIGEIVMCYPQVVLLAAERGKKVIDMINQLFVHGMKNIL